MVSPRNVPIHPLSDYGPGMSAGEQFFIGRFEQSIASRPNRLRFHRHTYYEAFLINGKGSYFADFRECIAGPTLIFVSPGQVHRWNQKPRMTGPMVCFTQEFYLVHTSMNVSEIAYALNFEDPAYFGRFFRRLTDKAPGNFREEFSEKHQT